MVINTGCQKRQLTVTLAIIIILMEIPRLHKYVKSELIS